MKGIIQFILRPATGVSRKVLLNQPDKPSITSEGEQISSPSLFLCALSHTECADGWAGNYGRLRYSLGETDAWLRKNLQKSAWEENPSLSAIS